MLDINKLLESKRVEVSFAETNVDRLFIKNFRKTHNLTQVALANILGVTKKAIEKWEQGTNNINKSSAVLLTLLKNNPELIKQLYSVNIKKGKWEEAEFQPVRSCVVKTSFKAAINSFPAYPIASLFL